MSPDLQIQLEPLTSSRRADAVFEQLRSRILTGALAPGSQLPNERELAEALGVNRASVREALKRLEFLELIEVQHGQGSFVCELSGSSALQLVEAILREPRLVTRELLAQLLEFRRHITLQVVDMAARRGTPAHFERARDLIRREEEAAGDPVAALQIDLEMNSLLGEASGNLLYQLLTNLFSRLVEHLGPLYYNASRDHARSLETHRLLLAALEAHDADAARRTLEVMLDYSERSILARAEELEAAGHLGPEREA